MPCLAMSIIPFEVTAPTKMPTAATAKRTESFTVLEPMPALKKFPASVDTPAVRS